LARASNTQRRSSRKGNQTRAALDAYIIKLEQDCARLDFLQSQLHDESTGAIGDVEFGGSWGGCSMQVGSEDLFERIDAKGTLRDLLDFAMQKGIQRRVEVPDVR
jgi:hypothetical protein